MEHRKLSILISTILLGAATTASAILPHFPATPNAKILSTTSTPVIAVPAGMPSQGTAYPGNPAATIASIQNTFPSVLLWAFNNNPSIDYQITQMDDRWLGVLSHEYYIRSNGYTWPLLQAAAKHLSARNLTRIAAAFGPAATVAVNNFAPSSVRAAYITSPAYPRIPRSQLHYASHGLTAATTNGVPGYVPNPAMNMALEDIFLEFYAAGTGTTLTEATVMTAYWAKGPLGLAAGFGYGTGTALYKFGEWVKPGIFEDFIENLVKFFGQPFVDDNPLYVNPDGTAITYPFPPGPTTIVTPLDGPPGSGYEECLVGLGDLGC